MEALEEFPKDAEKIYTKQGTAYLVKMDIFKGLLYYSIKDDSGINKLYALHKDKMDEILSMNSRGEKPESLGVVQYIKEDIEEDFDFEDVTGQIELPDRKSKSRRRNNRRSKNKGGGQNRNKSRTNAPKDRNSKGDQKEKPVDASPGDKSKSSNRNKRGKHSQNKPAKRKNIE